MQQFIGLTLIVCGIVTVLFGVAVLFATPDQFMGKL